MKAGRPTPQDWPGPLSPSRPGTGGSLGRGRHRAGSIPLLPSANSRRCNQQLCSTLPGLPQWGCTLRRDASQVRAPTGQEASRAHGPRSGTRGWRDGDTASPREGDRCTPPPRHRATRVSSPSALLQDKGQSSMTLGPGACLALPLKAHGFRQGPPLVCRPHSLFLRVQPP